MIHSFSKYLLNVYCTPGTVLGSDDTAVNNTDKVSAVTELSAYRQQHKAKYTQFSIPMMIRSYFI